MIKNWKNFCKYRESLIKKNIEGELYLKTLKDMEEIRKKYSPKIVKHQFLWFKWEEKTELSFWDNHRFIMEMRLNRGFSEFVKYLGVPDKTYENFLDWKFNVNE